MRNHPTCNEWRHPLPIAGLNLDLVSNVDEDVGMAHRYQCELAKI